MHRVQGDRARNPLRSARRQRPDQPGDTTHDPLPTPQWQARIEENRLGTKAIEVPVFQYHATTDEIVNTPQADALHHRYCDMGVPVTWKTYVSDHLSGIFAGNADAGQFLADRFEGKPAEPNC
uniref:lipase family protein n=1 Tax=Saccharopolyspora terrae TaxID=2530384 RepID=UPI001F4038B1|nr:lipase family protein [Saccharopolyspora terrae]